MSRNAAPTRKSATAPQAPTNHQRATSTTLSQTLGIAALLAALIWSYWHTIIGLMQDWRNDPNYSVGALVPLLAIYVIWLHRPALRRIRIQTAWSGIAIVFAAQLVRLLAHALFYQSGERYALVITIIGLVLFLFGWKIFWQLRWVCLFLFLMVPLPGRIHNLISGPLQQAATACTIFVLDIIAVNVTSEGNILVLGEHTRVGIAEACSGLRMLTAFIVVTAVIAFMVNRPRWQRVVLVLSSIPVAIICNVLRLVITTVLYAHTTSEVAERFFHDFAGITMMPVAIAILVGELWLMNVLVLPDPPPQKHQPAKPRPTAD